MTQLNSNSIKAILQEELNQDGDFLKEMILKEKPIVMATNLALLTPE